MLALKLHHVRLQEITSRLAEVAERSPDAAMIAEAGWLLAEADQALDRVRQERSRLLGSSANNPTKRRPASKVRVVAV
ncbi:hypothetical protein [Chthonobacter albigriseus]|uniref:hypothetical protein n=1 Tax=Chthonobacter albigriseus TaxID=1683161 RepID=UPI0015EEAFF7|nr:hypothetical protein [Chthonobacter albigriseus]